MSVMQLRRMFGLRFCLFAYIIALVLAIVILMNRSIFSAWDNSLVEDTSSNASLDYVDDSVDYDGDVTSETIPTRNNLNRLSSNSCEILHLALVCGGFNSTRSFYVLLKSILFYRTDSIQLHMFVDNISRRILEHLFSTWKVSDLSVKYYNITEHEMDVSWITNQHYSHRYGLMKLVFLSLLSTQKQLTDVILIDTDMLALGNANQLWANFRRMKGGGGEMRCAFGMVENQSDWYLGDNKLSVGRSVWPAIGRGYNSGLILVNLKALRRRDWSELWRQVAVSELTLHLTASLADQDIFNAVLRSHPDMVCKLPCEYNLQLNDHTDLDKMCNHTRGFKLVHWNSPHKLSTRNPTAKYFQNWYRAFTNWSGRLLEQSPCSKSWREEPSDQQTAGSDPICSEILPRPSDRLRTYLYFLDFEVEETENDVTLVVHFSLDRLQVLDKLASHWLGPISAAIYLSEAETDLLLVSVENSDFLSGRKNIGYHLLFQDHGFNYPINRLRNVALNNAITPFVFLSDIDFLPSFNLYNYLRSTISNLLAHGDSDPLARRALVVPAFENLQYKFDFPLSKAELLTQLNLGSISMFRDQLWPQGHAPTNYPRWRLSTRPYKIEWRPDYEPFIVTSRNVPRFDERFVGFGWNKVEHITELAASNYEFIVLPEAFVIHKFHSASYDIMRHRESSKYRKCTKHLKREFLIELRQKHPDFFSQFSSSNNHTTTIESVG